MDGTGQAQDTSAKQDSSVAKAQGTSQSVPQTFTKEQVDKVVSDALAKAGREYKELKGKLDSDINAFKTEKTTWEQQREAEFIERYKDDPDALKSYKAEQNRKAKEADIAEREKKVKASEEQLNADREQVRILKRIQTAAEVALEKKVSVDAILKLAKDDTREAMEVIAEVLPKVEAPIIPDSGRTSGGGTDLSKLTPKQLGNLAYSKKK